MTSHIPKQADVEHSRPVAPAEVARTEFRVVPVTDSKRFSSMSSREIRESFLIDQLFLPGRVQLTYSDYDRVIVGSVVPYVETISLDGGGGLRARYFTERRELGVMNLGGPGVVRIGRDCYELGARDGLYVGRGNPDVGFQSVDAARPAAFYLVSYPAHAAYPVRLMRKTDAECVQLGDVSTANRRSLYKYIHAGGAESCQLVMGLTELAVGSVWNTMPVHVHERRSEVYLYFDLPESGLVVHCLGRPQETRHVLVRNRQAVLAPSWSIHAGAGTSNYSFIWAMGGENQEFSDMTPIPTEDLA